MFIVELPLPVTELGLKLTVTRFGTPDADSETVPLKPPVPVTVMVEWPELLRLIVSDAGEALSEKPADVLVTVRVTVVVSCVLPEVPVTVMGYVPAATVDATEMFMVELPAPVMEVGLKLTVTPLG